MHDTHIPIMLSCDDRFVRHAAVTIISIVKNSARRYRFYVLNCGISEANVQKLKAWDLGDNEIVVVKMEKNAIFESIPLRRGLTASTLYRNMIPDLFPELDKAIYLDCDIVVVGDLGELWDVDLGDKLLGVVYEDYFLLKRQTARRMRSQADPQKRYFNNGMLLMNTRKMRDWHFYEKLVQYFRDHAAEKLLGQDVQNRILNADDVLSLPPKWNFLVFTCYAKRIARTMPPVVMHFVNYQPWKLYPCVAKYIPTFFCRCCRHYHRYAQLTPWANEPDRTLTPYRCLKTLLHASRSRLKQLWLSLFEKQ